MDIKITIRALGKGEIFTGDIYAASFFNEKGQFDILPEHTNYIGVIKNKIILYISKDNKKEFEFSKGLVRCRENNIEVYFGI